MLGLVVGCGQKTADDEREGNPNSVLKVAHGDDDFLGENPELTYPKALDLDDEELKILSIKGEDGVCEACIKCKERDLI